MNTQGRPRTTPGGLHPVIAYIDNETFTKLESVRGRIPRSAFVSDILSELFEDVKTNEPTI